LDDSEALYGSITLPPVLKVDSEATLGIGTARITCAILDKMQYFKLLAFHHAKALNSGSISIPCHPSLRSRHPLQDRCPNQFSEAKLLQYF
jgi:hypothetical protein